MNLGILLEQRAKESPNSVALIYEGKDISFAELNRNVNRLANGLKSLGIEKGDRIALMLPNTPEFIYAFFACQKIGVVVVPFNTMYKGGEILYILKDSKAKAIITLTNFVPLINEVKPELPELKYIITTGERSLTFADPDSTIFVQAVLSKELFNDVDDAYQKFGDIIVEGLTHLGLKGVWYKHRGSLRIKGKKIAGFYFTEVENLYILNIICFLSPLKFDLFFSAIWVPPEIRDKVIEPLASVEEELGRRPTDEEFKAIMIGAIEKHFGITLKQDEFTREEKFALEKQRVLTKRR